MNEFISLIRELGFPIAVAWFLLWKLNGKLERFGALMAESTQTLKEVAELLKSHDERTREAIKKVEHIEDRIK